MVPRVCSQIIPSVLRVLLQSLPIEFCKSCFAIVFCNCVLLLCFADVFSNYVLQLGFANCAVCVFSAMVFCKLRIANYVLQICKTAFATIAKQRLAQAISYGIFLLKWHSNTKAEADNVSEFEA